MTFYHNIDRAANNLTKEKMIIKCFRGFLLLTKHEYHSLIERR